MVESATGARAQSNPSERYLVHGRYLVCGIAVLFAEHGTSTEARHGSKQQLDLNLIDEHAVSQQYCCSFADEN